MADLRTDYQDDVLDASENTARVYDLVDSDGNVVLAGVHLEDKTVYTTEGDDYGAADINEQNEKINGLNADLSELKSERVLYSQTLSVATSYKNVLNAIHNAYDSFKDHANECKLVIARPTQTNIYHPFIHVDSEARVSFSASTATSEGMSVFNLICSATSSSGFATIPYPVAVGTGQWTSTTNTNLEVGTVIKIII